MAFFSLVVFVIVARPGFEPRQTEPKSVVLPLYYRAPSLAGCKSKDYLIFPKIQNGLSGFFLQKSGGRNQVVVLFTLGDQDVFAGEQVCGIDLS